jgi:hypothetical protein
MDHSIVGWMLLRLTLAAPIVLMAWLIRRDIRRDQRESQVTVATRQGA